MKFYFLPAFIFLLLLSNSRTQPHGGPTPSQEEEQAIEETSFTSIDDSQVTSNPQLQGLVSIGVQDVTQQAIQDGSLPEGNYQLSQVISAARSEDDYRFEVEITDSQGNTIDIIFFISYDPFAGTTEVTSYDVLGNEEGETTGELGEAGEDGFVVLDPSVAETNPIIRGIIILGIQEAIKQAITDGSLHDSNYQLADVYSIEQGVENPDEYKFDVSVINDLQNTVRMNFDLLYDSESNSVQVLSFRFPNTPIPYGEETVTEAETGIEEVEVEVEAEETFEETPPIIEEETQEIEGEQTEDGFIILDPSVAQTDTEIAGILSVGVQETIKLAIAKGSLFNSSYELVQVFSAQQNIANPDEYRFNVSVRNSSQSTVIMDFDLFYNESTNTVDVNTYNTTVLENDEQILPPVEEGVGGTQAGYQEIYFDRNDPSSFLYEMGKAGLETVVTMGVLDGTIPSSYYLATNIISVSKKVKGTKTYYRFDLYASDGYGNSARFTYIVSYDTATSTPDFEDMQITDVVRAW